MTASNSKAWDLTITSHRGWFEFHLGELWQYRDLLWIYFHRNIITEYKQTILGPIWIFIPPVITTLLFTVVFGKIAQLSTDGLPGPLFYMSGIVIWNYFSSCFSGTSNSLSGNAGLFGKVYFPRIIIPVATLLSGLVRFFIQFILFLCILIYYTINGNVEFFPNMYLVILFPLLIIIMGVQGLGYGLLFSAITTKYRDLRYLIGYCMRLLMYASPIIFPLSIVPDNYRIFILLNPITSVIEIFRYISLGNGQIDLFGLLYSITFTFIIFIAGLLIFNRVEKNFIDTA